MNFHKVILHASFGKILQYLEYFFATYSEQFNKLTCSEKLSDLNIFSGKLTADSGVIDC